MEQKTSHSSQEFLEIPGLVGESSCIRNLKKLVFQYAHSGATVLLMGETGTGKEVVARAIHYQSERKGFPFIPLNCGALPDELFENELFGHERGAYTDATKIFRGILAEAENGTLFLDEVDALSLCAQVKVLRFLQDKEYRPLGSARSLKANVRLIAATNRNLLRLIQESSFREDLFYRLNILPMRIPPLCERMEDVSLLTEYFLNQHQGVEKKKFKEIMEEITQMSLTYNWPGNVRELEAMIQRMVVLIGTSSKELLWSMKDRNNENDLIQNSWRQIKTQGIKNLENQYLRKIMADAKGNISKASKLAKVDRRSFQRMLRKHNIPETPFKPLPIRFSNHAP